MHKVPHFQLFMSTSDKRQLLLDAVRAPLGTVAEFQSVTVEYGPADAHIVVAGLEADVDELHVHTLSEMIEAAKGAGWSMAYGILLVGTDRKIAINIFNSAGVLHREPPSVSSTKVMSDTTNGGRMIRQIMGTTTIPPTTRASMAALVHTVHDTFPVFESWKWGLNKSYPMLDKPAVVFKLGLTAPAEHKDALCLLFKDLEKVETIFKSLQWLESDSESNARVFMLLDCTTPSLKFIVRLHNVPVSLNTTQPKNTRHNNEMPWIFGRGGGGDL